MGYFLETFLILAFVGSFVYVAHTFAPWAPSRTRDLDRALKLAEFKPGDVFYDL